jgi:hypothetical protein
MYECCAGSREEDVREQNNNIIRLRPSNNSVLLLNTHCTKLEENVFCWTCVPFPIIDIFW